jgi:hypothetical protein
MSIYRTQKSINLAKTLIKKNGSLKDNFPTIASEWFFNLNKPHKPSEFTSSSGTLVWWKCPKNSRHIYEMKISKRTIGQNCPYCAGKKVLKEESVGALYPNLLKEFDKENNKNVSLFNLTSGSDVKINWKCKFGHSWNAPISRRTGGSNCPECSGFNTSKNEIRIFTELKKIIPDVLNRYKYKSYEIDIFIPSLKIGIEYDGSFYHRNKFEKDNKKNNFFQTQEIKILRLRELPLEKISKYDIQIPDIEITKTYLNKIMDFLCLVSTDKKIYKDYKKLEGFIAEKEYKKILSYFPSPPPEESFKAVYPEAAKYWDYKKNYPLTPDMFMPNSGKTVWWICNKNKKHSWQNNCNNQSRNKTCSFCSGKYFIPSESLKHGFPHIAAELHKTKNIKKGKKLSAKDFYQFSKSKVWWKCSKCENEWQAIIDERTKLNRGRCTKCNNSFGLATKERSITVGGKTFIKANDAYKYFKVARGTVDGRIARGWTLDEAFGLKKRKKVFWNQASINIKGKEFPTFLSACRFYKIKKGTVEGRIARGWSIDDAFLTEARKISKK